MRDQFGRSIEYLRISVTDKCNLRCSYCMPVEGLDWIPKVELLTYEEITDIVGQMARMGLRRVRLTGGEPLVRRDLPDLVGMLAAVPGIEDISLSTNAVLLSAQARELKQAGVQRVNISLDTLRRERFEQVARRPARFFDDTIRGIEAAEAVGMEPIKLNVVLLRGINDDEVPDMVELIRERPWHIRLIELMPVAGNLHLTGNFMGADEILDRLRRHQDLEPVAGPLGNGPASYFRCTGSRGSLGVITPLSQHYCDSCNRMRLTADGRLRTCLFGAHEVDLKQPLRTSGQITAAVQEALAGKPAKHDLETGSTSGSGGLVALSQVGG
ncbi:MAG: GTP 3',8-cyclase MoaA [Gemmatimonadota bacterium]